MPDIDSYANNYSYRKATIHFDSISTLMETIASLVIAIEHAVDHIDIHLDTSGIWQWEAFIFYRQ